MPAEPGRATFATRLKRAAVGPKSDPGKDPQLTAMFFMINDYL